MATHGAQMAPRWSKACSEMAKIAPKWPNIDQDRFKMALAWPQEVMSSRPELNTHANYTEAPMLNVEETM